LQQSLIARKIDVEELIDGTTRARRVSYRRSRQRRFVF
jgi:hypothetical protein